MSINILAVGDVTNAAGLDFLSEKLRGIIRLNNIAFTVVNGENASFTGLTPDQAEQILNAGADVVTLGNHAFGKSSIFPYLDDCPYILRPANYAPQNSGRGFGIYETAFGPVCVINLIGRCGMLFGPDNPFLEVDRILKQVDAKVILVDLHAEATSEKMAMGHYLDGRVSALWGTHTHVQTSDAQVFPKGTGYITDLGMAGASHSVLGAAPEWSISTFLGYPPKPYMPAPGGVKLEGAIFEIDEKSGKCLRAEALRIE